jgi:aerobic carbon-monoxide dehydrogenase medium subunit
MIRSNFRFERPDTIEDAVKLLADAGGRGRVLGGGSMLIPSLTAGLEDPSIVIDPQRLEIDGIRISESSISVGARASYAALAKNRIVRHRLPLLASMVDEVTGGPGLWNLATLGGSACLANPASDGPGCLTALDAEFRLVSSRGQRVIPAANFFLGPFETARRPDELLVEIVIPTCALPQRSAYAKLKHAASSWPIVTASCLMIGSRDKRIRLCLGAVAPMPVSKEWPYNAELAIDRIAAMAAETVAQIATPWTDELADFNYRQTAAVAVGERVLRTVAGLGI